MSKIFKPKLKPLLIMMPAFLLMVFLASISMATGSPEPSSVAFPPDTNTPVADQQLTFAEADKTFTVARPLINVAVKLNAKIVDSAVAIDGQTVNAGFVYKGHWQDDPWSDASWYVIDNYNEGVLTSTPPANLSDGNHVLTVTARDIQDNTFTKSWNFTVAQPPVISGIQPVNGAMVTNAPVSIKAIVSDPNGPAIEQNSILLTVDNNKVIPEVVYDAGGTVTITYTSGALNNDKQHAVSLTVADTKGNTATAGWKFHGLLTGTNTGFIARSPVDETVLTSTPAVSVHFTDLEKKYNVSRANIKIDNLTPQVKRSPDIIGANSEYSLSYVTEPLADGLHTVTVSIQAIDPTLPSITTSWKFQVNMPPTIKKVLPVNTVTANIPTIAVYATDNNGRRADGTGSYTDPLSFGKGILKIDNNEPVVLQLDKIRYKPTGVEVPNINGRMSYKPGTPLSDGVHKAVFTVYDSAGNIAATEWSFTVDTNIGPDYPGMPAKDDATCLTCHKKIAPVNGGTHPEVANCYRCHTNLVWKSRLFNNCTYCHFDNRTPGYPQYFSYRHESDGYPTFANIETAGHPLNDVHLSATNGCEKCHSRILTIEHNRPDRTDPYGSPINCGSCHTSSDQKIQAAIRNKDTNCNSCHAEADHQIIHESGLDSKCQTCHNKILSVEHISNATTQGKGYTCDTCHRSERNEVKRAITTGNLKCSGCHQQAHGIGLADSTPVDIPLYGGFLWTKPMEAVLFVNDSGTPAGYEQGQVVMSNRRTDVTAAQVWSYYESNLRAKGWRIQSGAYVEGSSYLSAEFVKDTRALTIKAYNTAANTGAGETLKSGYRVELWYR